MTKPSKPPIKIGGKVAGIGFSADAVVRRVCSGKVMSRVVVHDTLTTRGSDG